MLFYACQKNRIQYPETKRVDVVDNYFGTKVADPYRWLEDENSPEVAEWVSKQNELTSSYLGKIPFREKIRERLTGIWNYTTMGVPFKEGGRYFYFKKDGLQNQSVLYVMETIDSEPRVLLDPNTFSTDGTIALSEVSPSRDGKYLAYAVNDGGSDWQKIKVIALPEGKELKDEISWVKFSSIAWYANGFFYSRYDEPKKGEELSTLNQYHKVYYHTIGTDSNEDKLIFANSSIPLGTIAPKPSRTKNT